MSMRTLERGTSDPGGSIGARTQEASEPCDLSQDSVMDVTELREFSK